MGEREKRILWWLRFSTVTACVVLAVMLTVQFVSDRDFHGIPFLIFAAMLAPIACFYFLVAWLLPEDRPETH